jgi:hypothetical protein
MWLVGILHKHQHGYVKCDYSNESVSKRKDEGIGFWFDTYSYGDHHEEIVELREQLGIRTDPQD